MPEINNGIINYGRIGGNASVSSETVHTGDAIAISASNANVGIKSSLDRALKTVSSWSAADDASRRRLQELLGELSDALACVPPEKHEDAQRVAKQAEALLEVAKGRKPDKTVYQLAVQGLKQAAKSVGSVAPTVLGIIEGVIGIVQALSGV